MMLHSLTSQWAPLPGADYSPPESRLELSCFIAFVVPGEGIWAGAALPLCPTHRNCNHKSVVVLLPVQGGTEKFCAGFSLKFPGFASFVWIPFTHSCSLLCWCSGLLGGVILISLRDERAKILNEGIFQRLLIWWVISKERDWTSVSTLNLGHLQIMMRRCGVCKLSEHIPDF